jgi:hypothetical protein
MTVVSRSRTLIRIGSPYDGDSDRSLEPIRAAVPVRDEMGSNFAPNFHTDDRRQDWTEVEKSHFGTCLAQHFISLAIPVRARRGFKKCEPAGTTSIVAHPQKECPAARRDVLARLVAQFYVRDFNSMKTVT